MAEPAFNPVFLLFVVPLTAIGLWGLAAGASKLVVWRRLRRSRAAAAYDLRAGPIEVEGIASVFETTLPAPFRDDTETLLYEYTVQRYQYDDDGSDWDTVDSGTVGVPFVLTVDGVEVVVDPTDAEIHLTSLDRLELDADEEPTGALARFIQENQDVTHRAGSFSLGPIDIATGTRHRFSVSRLDPGETCYVTGTMTPAYDARFRTDDQQWVIEKQSRSLLDSVRAPTPLTVADVAEAEAQKRIRNSGLFRLAIGLVCGGIALALAMAAF